MNTYTLMPLHSFKMKVAGILLSIISIAMMVIVSYFDNFTIISGFDKTEHFNLFFWLNGASLFFIVFSRERIEDERISLIRDRSYRSTLAVLLSILLAFSFVSLVFRTEPMYAAEIFPVVINVVLIYHLAIFYYRLCWDVKISQEEVTVFQNIRNNKVLYITYLIINIVAAILLLIL